VPNGSVGTSKFEKNLPINKGKNIKIKIDIFIGSNKLKTSLNCEVFFTSFDN